MIISVAIMKYLSVFCEQFFLLDMLDRLASEKGTARRRKKSRLFFLSLAPFSVICICLQLKGEMWNYVWLLFPTGILFIFFAVKQDYSLYLFFITTYVVGVMTQRFIWAQFFHYLLDPLQLFTEDQMTVLIFAAVIPCIFLLSHLLYLLGKRTTVLIPDYYWHLLLGIQFLLFVFLTVAIPVLISEYSLTFLVLVNTFYIFVFIVACLFSRMSRDFGKLLDQSLYEQQAAIQDVHQEEMTGLYREMRELRHELKNHFFYLEQLIADEEYAEAKDYLSRFHPVQNEKPPMIDVGNTALNAILNSKHYLAETKGTALYVEGAVPDSLEIHSADLFGLVSNLLENSIENINPENPVIRVRVEMVKIYLSISVYNTVKAPVLENNPRLITTKKKFLAHGYGVKVIRSIVEKYNGILDYFDDRDGFTVSVLLMNQTPELLTAGGDEGRPRL